MRIKIYLCFFVISIYMQHSCSSDSNYEMANYTPQIVVEGSIENDNFAKVLLSWSAAFTEDIDKTLLNHIIKSAKVSVSDGFETEILFLTTNENTIPPYEYRGNKIKGETGKTYSLKIEYQHKTIEATTYIPEPIEIEKLEFKLNPKNNSIGNIVITFPNLSDEYYLVSTKIQDREIVFTPCLFGIFDNRSYPHAQKLDLQINKGPTLYPTASYETDFATGSTVDVKLSTISETSYKFWISYQNEIINTQNPLFPSGTSLKSNVKGGIGIWSGYGSNTKIIKCN